MQLKAWKLQYMYRVLARKENMSDPHCLHSPVSWMSLAYITAFPFYYILFFFPVGVGVSLDIFVFLYRLCYPFFCLGYPFVVSLFCNVPGTGQK